MRSSGLLLLLWSVSAFAQTPEGASIVQIPEPAVVHRGHDLYQRYCQACHGAFGDGRGDSADFLPSKPRDFRPGIYKLRSTPSGTLPTDADLFRSIREGIWGSGMPRWSGVSDGEIWDLVAYVESFSDRFYKEERGVAVVVPPEPSNTAESAAAGKKVYAAAGCASCHGTDGRGDGPSGRGLVDVWGNPIKSTSFAEGHWKSGPKPADLYRSLVTGLDGTPMPSFAAALDAGQTWDLVHYLVSLRSKGGWRAGDSPGDQGLFDAHAP